MDSRKKYEELKEEGRLPRGKTPLSVGEKSLMQELTPCHYVRREGESCRLNNNCTYPDCPIEFENPPHIIKDFYPIDWSLLNDSWEEHSKKTRPKLEKWLWKKWIKFLTNASKRK